MLKVCGKYALQGSSRALYNPLDPTHKECTWPVPFQGVGYAVLFGGWWSVVWWGDLILWSGLVVVVCSNGLIWWSGWRCNDVVFWFGVLIWGWIDGLVRWCNSEVLPGDVFRELKIGKKKCWVIITNGFIKHQSIYLRRNEEKLYRNSQFFKFICIFERYLNPKEVCKTQTKGKGSGDDSFPFAISIFPISSVLAHT